VRVTFSVDGLGGGAVCGGGEGGGSDGGVVTIGVGACNKPAISEFWSTFNADREPLNERDEPPPTEAVERTPAAAENGKKEVGEIAAEPVEVPPERGAVIDFVTSAIGVGVTPLLLLPVPGATCPAATFDIGAARRA